MSQLHQTKNRIKSVDSTRKITKAMELVASVKLRKWQKTHDNIKEYVSTLERIVSKCFKGVSQVDKTLPTALKVFDDTSKKLMVVISSSLGLCGGYNYNMFKFVDSIFNEGDKLILVGTKSEARYANDDYEHDLNQVDILERLDFSKVKKLAKLIEQEYATGEYGSVVLVYTAYRNSLTFEPTTLSLFPLCLNEEESMEFEPIYEPNRKEFMNLVLPKYIETILYGKLVESMVSEQASRRNAMDNATDNADELVAKLTLQYNKARQASITNELIDVVAGARSFK